MLTENSGALKDTIANFKVFSEGLARNTGKLDGIVAGLERMTGVTAPPPKITYDLRALQNPGPVGKIINVQWAIPEPTAVAMLETQRFLFSPAQEYPGFAEAMWADALPKLIQARLIESFENYDIAHAPLRMADIGQTEFQLLVDVRRFRIAVELRACRRDWFVGQDRRQEAARSSPRGCSRRARSSAPSHPLMPSPPSAKPSAGSRGT